MDTLSHYAPPGKPHYVYTLAYPEDYSNGAKACTVFYVGKGQGNRIDEHEYEARGSRSSHKCNVIRKIWADGKQIIKAKLDYFATHEEALQYEIALIFFMDGLTNLTRGGEGTLDYTGEIGRKISAVKMGHEVSKEARRKLSEANKARLTPEYRRKLSEVHKKNPRPDLIAKMVEAREGKPSWPKGKKRTEEQRRQMSESRKGKPTGRKLSEEHKRKLVEANRNRDRTVSEETRQKLSAKFKDREFTPEWRKKISEARKGQRLPKQSPETIAKRVASIKKRNAEKRNAFQLQFPEMTEAAGE